MQRYSLLMVSISNPMAPFMMCLIYLPVASGLDWIWIGEMQTIVRVSLGKRSKVVMWGLP